MEKKTMGGGGVTMNVRVLLFAQAKQWMGAPELLFILDHVTTVGQFLRRQQHRLAPIMTRLDILRIAVNQEFAGMDTPIHDGDEIAFLPPVSGG